MKKLKKLILNHLPLFFTDYLCEYTKNPETLEILSEHEYWDIRQCVVDNKYISIELLKKLATDSDWFVRSSAIKNPKATEDVLLSYRAYIWHKKLSDSFVLENCL